MKKSTLLIIIVCFSLFTYLFCLIKLDRSEVIDVKTAELCAEYAKRNHKSEMTVERYEWLGKDFVDNYNWYESCINHTRYPVAK